MYNPIFEQENRNQELQELKDAIKLRAGSDQVKDLANKFSHFVKSHPIFTSLAIGVFSTALVRNK